MQLAGYSYATTLNPQNDYQPRRKLPSIVLVSSSAFYTLVTKPMHFGYERITPLIHIAMHDIRSREPNLITQG